MDPWAFVYMFTVAMIWGLTNPLMKQSSAGIEKCSGFFLELQFLVTNWKVVNSYGRMVVTEIVKFVIQFH